MTSRILLFVCLWLFSAQWTFATELPRPVDDVLLTISGNIENTNGVSAKGEKVLELDLKMIESIESKEFQITLPWKEGKNAYKGALLDKLMAYAGAGSSELVLDSLDGYAVELDMRTFESYPLIVAYRFNGHYLSVRDLGPLWLVFPFDDYPELNTNKNRARSVWQLNTIVVR